MRPEPLELSIPGPDHSFSNGITCLAAGFGAYLTVFDRGHGDVDIDAVHQRSADLGAVADDHLRSAPALLLGISIVAAGA